MRGTHFDDAAFFSGLWMDGHPPHPHGTVAFHDDLADFDLGLDAGPRCNGPGQEREVGAGLPERWATEVADPAAHTPGGAARGEPPFQAELFDTLHNDVVVHARDDGG